MSNPYRHLLPHARSEIVATELFSGASFDHSHEVSTMQAGINGLPDTVSRKAGWEKAATEARHTNSPERLARLVKYPQKGVRRAAATNPILQPDQIAYLADWALAKDDLETAQALVSHQRADVMLEAIPEQLEALVRKHTGRVSYELATNVVHNGPASALRQLVASPLGCRMVTEIVRAFDARYNSYELDAHHPVLEVDEVLTHLVNAHPQSDMATLAADRLWGTTSVELAHARAMVRRPSTTIGRSRYGTTSQEAATYLLDHFPEVGSNMVGPTLQVLLRSYSDGYDEATYDRILDLLDERGQELDTVAGPLRDLAQHQSSMADRQLDRLVEMFRAQGDNEHVDAIRKHALASILTHDGHRLSDESVMTCARLMPAQTVVAWVTHHVMGDRSTPSTEFAFALRPALDVVRVLSERYTEEATARWIGQPLREFDEYDPYHYALAQALIDGAGKSIFEWLGDDNIAKFVMRRLEAEFGDDLERIRACIGLFGDWESTFPELVEMTWLLTGGRPDPQPDVVAIATTPAVEAVEAEFDTDEDVDAPAVTSTTGAQMFLFA